MLLQNKSFLASNGIRYLVGAPAVTGVLARSLLSGKVGAQRNRYIGGAALYKGNSTPVGYTPTGGAWYPNRVSGGLASRFFIIGEGDVAQAILAGGLGGQVTMAGSSSLTALGSLIIDMIANIIAAGGLTASIFAVMDAIVDMVGAGDIIPALGALGGMVSDLTGAAAIMASPYAQAFMTSSISSSSILSPENLASSVWNAMIANYQTVGTTGKALTSAGSAGDPWASLLASYSDDETFGAFVQKLITTAKFLALK